jgi:hypothetical protein
VETTDADLEAEQKQIRARIAELSSELSTLQARLQQIERVLEQQPRVRAIGGSIQLVAAAKPHRPQGAPVKVVSGAASKPPVAPIDLVRQLSRGTALFGAGPDDHGRGEVALLLRGESAHLASLGESPDVQFRAGVLTLAEAGVALVPVVVCLGREPEPQNLYEAWVNDSVLGIGETLQALAVQEGIVVQLHGDDCRLERVLRVPNPLQAFARQALGIVRAARPLSADELHQARTAVYKQLPSVRALWRALSL